MTKFSDRIKKSAKTSPIILANDYDPKTPNIESKTLKNIKTLGEHLCGIKINFHLLLQLDKKQILQIQLTKEHKRYTVSFLFPFACSTNT